MPLPTFYALVLAVWATVHPRAPTLRDAPAIAKAWAEAVERDERAPVFGTKENDLAVGAYYALRESWLQPHAIGDGGESFGVWQQQSAEGRADVPTQARAWLDRLHDGARTCPDSPAAPLSGGCLAARRVADRRVRLALRALAEAKGGRR